jgi:aspartate-semialdehyde dehydrogenase
MVGRVMLSLLAKRGFPVTELIPVASKRSVGKQVSFNGKNYSVCTAQDALEKKPSIALFSAGGSTSLEWAPKFAAIGCVVIDNSSAWRMDKSVPLIVPEINANILTESDQIIANPNCSTIQLVMTLAPLHKAYTINRVIVSTYQSITGTGVKAVEQMEAERSGSSAEMVYPYRIDQNAIPHCDVFQENGYTKEEMKLANETKKIMGDDSILVSATAVRIPVMGGHSESVNITFEHDFEESSIRKMLHETPGVIVQDNPEMNIYPMPWFSKEKDDVFVGRIRRDHTAANSLNMWIVSDNLRKGAATNAIQIAEYLLVNKLVS